MEVHTICEHSLITKYCTKCGEVINPNAKVNPRCAEHHAEYKTDEWGYKYCPDCRELL